MSSSNLSYRTLLIRRLYATLNTLAEQRGVSVEELKATIKKTFRFISVTQLTDNAIIQLFLRLELEIIT
jgi:hypothetical protein